METEAVEAALETAQALDFSLAAMFTRASPVVQAVTVLLALASVWSWAVIVDKLLAFRKTRREIDMFEDAFWSGQPLDSLYDRVGSRPRSAAERVFAAGMAEWRRSFDKNGEIIPGARDRIDRALDVALARESERQSTRLTVLATVGSIAPFVGLFGTVWGIMTAFEEISVQQNTNLSTVAPGIAEALVTTAVGLLAAIPAVIFYNKLVGDAARLGARLEAFADEFAVILSRQMMRSSAA